MSDKKFQSGFGSIPKGDPQPDQFRPPGGPRDMPGQTPQRPKQTISNRIAQGVQSWKENADFRMKICNTCPDYAAPRCKLCGCFMVAKTKIPQARCPAGKW